MRRLPPRSTRTDTLCPCTTLFRSLIVGCVLVVSLVFAVQAGLTGRTPGKAMRGLKVVDPEGGKPIGVPRSMLRSLIVGIGSLPMFGLGVATLAWTAVEDRTRERRGWHDRSEEHTSELQSLMRISYAVFCLTKKNK